MLPAMYDDGGISGGTLERPALQRLLADIAAGKVDTVVVYKVDLLTRSLADFAKTLAAEAGVSRSYFTRILKLSFLAPNMVVAILEGRQSATLNAASLTRDAGEFPLAWTDQAKAFRLP